MDNDRNDEGGPEGPGLEPRRGQSVEKIGKLERIVEVAVPGVLAIVVIEGVVTRVLDIILAMATQNALHVWGLIGLAALLLLPTGLLWSMIRRLQENLGRSETRDSEHKRYNRELLSDNARLKQQLEEAEAKLAEERGRGR